MIKKQYAVLLFMLVGLMACSKKELNEASLAGKWKVTEFLINAPSLSPSIIMSGKEEGMSSVYTFSEGERIHLVSKFVPDGKEGAWNYQATDSLLVFNYGREDKKLESYKVISFDGNMMTWTQDMGKMGSLEISLVKE